MSLVTYYIETIPLFDFETWQPVRNAVGWVLTKTNIGSRYRPVLKTLHKMFPHFRTELILSNDSPPFVKDFFFFAAHFFFDKNITMVTCMVYKTYVLDEVFNE